MLCGFCYGVDFRFSFCLYAFKKFGESDTQQLRASVTVIKLMNYIATLFWFNFIRYNFQKKRGGVMKGKALIYCAIFEIRAIMHYS